ncbi:mitotic checkpoint serine/threonine-protein kinase BUB1 [Thalassophryne amazonica]|uniref:mitotic checkpoint serine/threonine-protein kinase BUB1 n=1 Tax=Thalassophryne amazonica TaxID=390379 RepID=UPI0014713DFD|nr:mitotic checkpoint serine/threonine-protein kinase BUB1 [Thalassophryne amazonica]
MDVFTYLQCFKNTMSSYTGDDPLDAWDKFVEYLVQNVPADGATELAVVLDSLVQTFLNIDRYANDVRYVNYCIRCASLDAEPVALYNHIYSQGVGTQTAAFYVAWAQQCETRGLIEQADTVYQNALESHAQPADIIINEYRLFQTRTRAQTGRSGGGRAPLQESQLTNQMWLQTDSATQNKACPSQQSAHGTLITVSRSENVGVTRHQDSHLPSVSAYDKDRLVCEGSEFCFEELRANDYFSKDKEKTKNNRMETKEEGLTETAKSLMGKVFQDLELHTERLWTGHALSQPSAAEPGPGLALNSTQLPFGQPRLPHYLDVTQVGLASYADPTSKQESSAAPELRPQQDLVCVSVPPSSDNSLRGSEPPSQSGADQQPVNQSLLGPVYVSAVCSDSVCQGRRDEIRQPDSCRDVSLGVESEEKLDMSQGGAANLSHVTPNNSLGYVQATPSRVLPSPTVNTREALDVIMDMFQAPTLLEDPFPDTSVLHAAKSFDATSYTRNGGVAFLVEPPTAAPFTIFQDDDKENCSVIGDTAAEKGPIRALAEIPMRKSVKPMEALVDLMPDESTTWGAHNNSLNSLAACPNSTSDFAMLAQFVSTPFTHKSSFNNVYQDQETNGEGEDADAYLRRQTNKLSPIIEQSPSDDTGSVPAVDQLAPTSARHGTIVGDELAAAQHCMTSTITMAQAAVELSFRDQTLAPTDSSVPRTTGPDWTVCTSTELILDTSVKSGGAGLDQHASPNQDHSPFCDVPMSPESAPRYDWLRIPSPEATDEPDLDAFLSPVSDKKWNIPMSPERAPPCSDVPMSPEQQLDSDEPMNPDQHLRPALTEPGSAAVQLVSDPWDSDLLASLLSALNPPLTLHPHCITWQCALPSIVPKMTINMGKASLRVDSVLGEGAFATVYQATDPMTSERVVLKVQKAASPWEFYINTQLDARLQLHERHLYSSIRSAHLFNNGSVLLTDLHNYGTLLNAVNLYKNLSDKVMPQPLVMYFTACILHMVELLHSVNIIHADVKPDNIMLGERFLENRCLDPGDLDHGLVLIDLGQSIDMELFPRGTAFTTRCLTSGFQCTEMLSGKPWNYQTDYFGVAGTVHCMLFGTYMKVTSEDGWWKTNATFRRKPHSDLWLDFFHTLLNCGSLQSLRRLRSSLSAALLDNYRNKLQSLKSHLVVLLLESRRARR